MEQNELFGARIIMSISFNETEIIKNILKLHCSGDIELDPTYSTGNIYKQLEKPLYKFDLDPEMDDVVKSDCRSLPIKKESINTMMFDPPFVIGGKDHDGIKNGSNIIQRRFTNFKSFQQLKEMYKPSLSEFYRILKPNGILIFKCQDVIASSKQYFSHVYIHNWAVEIGFYPKDLFLLLAKSRLTDGRIQQHARKFHCYFWVLKKLV